MIEIDDVHNISICHRRDDYWIDYGQRLHFKHICHQHHAVPLLLIEYMRVGIKRKGYPIMPEKRGECLDIPSLFKGSCGKCMTRGVEYEMSDSCRFKHEFKMVIGRYHVKL